MFTRKQWADTFPLADQRKARYAVLNAKADVLATMDKFSPGRRAAVDDWATAAANAAVDDGYSFAAVTGFAGDREQWIGIHLNSYYTVHWMMLGQFGLLTDNSAAQTGNPIFTAELDQAEADGTITPFERAVLCETYTAEGLSRTLGQAKQLYKKPNAYTPRQAVPWRLVTGAFSGIGYAPQFKSSGPSTVLYTRRPGSILLPVAGVNTASPRPVSLKVFARPSNESDFLIAGANEPESPMNGTRLPTTPAGKVAVAFMSAYLPTVGQWVLRPEIDGVAGTEFTLKIG